MWRVQASCVPQCGSAIMGYAVCHTAAVQRLLLRQSHVPLSQRVLQTAVVPARSGIQVLLARSGTASQLLASSRG
jgi:hypothetical protein